MREMAEEQEKLLQEEIAAFDEELKQLAEKLEELAGVDCSFGACVLDPAMTDTEEKLAEVQKRRKIAAEIIDSLKACGV
jgi:hypothetical protein